MGTLTPLYEVRFFKAATGREPVREWLRGLPTEERRMVGEDIRRVQLRWPLGMPLVRKLEPGLWEIRSHLPRSIARVFFTFTRRTLVLLHGFEKTSARTPLDDLALARVRCHEVHLHES